MSSRPLTEEYLRSRDCVVIATDHSSYDWPWIARHTPLIVDCRNATRDVIKDAAEGGAAPHAIIIRA
jgi:UDP-N-acetyl-D-glucosamine dehydrogenase